MWQVLTNTFGALSEICKFQLHIQFQGLEKGNKTLAQFLQEAKGLSNALALVGRPLIPFKFNAVICRSLGLDYHSIDIALSVQRKPVNFHELYQFIAHEIVVKSSQ